PDLRVVETGADVADPSQLVAVVDREHERAERADAPTGAGRVADDDELLAAVRLDLQPLARAPALQVPRVEPLGHDPFEPLLLRGLEERLAVVELLAQPDRPAPPVEQLLQVLATLRERQVDERLAV